MIFLFDFLMVLILLYYHGNVPVSNFIDACIGKRKGKLHLQLRCWNYHFNLDKTYYCCYCSIKMNKTNSCLKFYCLRLFLILTGVHIVWSKEIQRSIWYKWWRKHLSFFMSFVFIYSCCQTYLQNLQFVFRKTVAYLHRFDYIQDAQRGRKVEEEWSLHMNKEQLLTLPEQS